MEGGEDSRGLGKIANLLTARPPPGEIHVRTWSAARVLRAFFPVERAGEARPRARASSPRAEG